MLVLVAGCSSSTLSGGARPDGGTDGGDPARPLTCAAIFNCTLPCNDEPCTDACLASGSAEGQNAALALAKCYTDNKCADATCLQTKCQASVDACLAQDAPPKGAPLEDGGAVQGNVPTELVGSFVHAAYGATERFKLNADGTGYYESGLTSLSSCAITESTTWAGTVVVDATTITIYATNVTNMKFQCGSKSQTTSPPETRRFRYTYDASKGVLTTIDEDCAAKYPDSPASQSLYCENACTRE